MPKVTVLMPVYNAEKFLSEAIDSILKQSFADFEFIIINDGSTDKSRPIIESYPDSRIKLYDNENNLGIIATLNKGFKLAQGELIARMDADDISLPDRLKLQVDFFNTHPSIGACGGWVKKFGQLNFISKYYTEPADIKAAFLFNVSLAHPTAMIRKKILTDHQLAFDQAYLHAEDYDFWVKFMQFSALANIPKVLLRYRLHQVSVTQSHNQLQQKNAAKVKLRQLAALGLRPSEHELWLHNSFKPESGIDIMAYLNQSEVWLNKILAANDKTKVYDFAALKKIIADRWLNICYANAASGVTILKKYWRTPLRQKMKMTDNIILLKFIFKALS